MEGTVASVPPQEEKTHNKDFLQLTLLIFYLSVEEHLLVLIKLFQEGDKSSIGFEAEVKDKNEKNIGTILKKLETEDLLKFGLILSLLEDFQ